MRAYMKNLKKLESRMYRLGRRSGMEENKEEGFPGLT